jgi:hypothetical protein
MFTRELYSAPHGISEPDDSSSTSLGIAANRYRALALASVL